MLDWKTGAKCHRKTLQNALLLKVSVKMLYTRLCVNAFVCVQAFLQIVVYAFMRASA